MSAAGLDTDIADVIEDAFGESQARHTSQLQIIQVADYVINIAAIMINSIFGMQIFNFKSSQTQCK